MKTVLKNICRKKANKNIVPIEVFDDFPTIFFFCAGTEYFGCWGILIGNLWSYCRSLYFQLGNYPLWTVKFALVSMMIRFMHFCTNKFSTPVLALFVVFMWTHEEQTKTVYVGDEFTIIIYFHYRLKVKTFHDHMQHC